MRTVFIATVATILTTGCTDPTPAPASEASTSSDTGDSAASGDTGPVAQTGTDSDSTGIADSSGGGVVDCQTPRPLPPAPVDCSGTTEVLADDVLIFGDEDPIPDLTGVRRIDGQVIVSETSLTNLDFLACVEEISGQVNVFGNAQLVDVGGLHSIRQIEDDFVFSENDALTDFSGLPQLEVVSSLAMNRNDAMLTISGFHRLDTIEQAITIRDNPVLQNIDGLGGLRVIGDQLAISANPDLCCASLDCVGSGLETPEVPPKHWGEHCNPDHDHCE